MISVVLLQRGHREGDALAEGLVLDLPFLGDGLRAERHAGRIEVEFRPLGAGQRPLVLHPQDELLAGMADVELHPRCLLPAVVDALQEIVEEALLQVQAVGAGEERPVRIAVGLEPLLLRGRLDEAVEVAPRVDALAAPVGAGQKRERDLGEVGRARAVPLVVEGMLLELLVDVDAVLGQLLVRERDGSGHRLAGVGVLLGPLPPPVLHVDHLVLGPELLELAQDAAVVAGVAVAVVLALPGDDRGQVRRVLSRHAPLVAGVVGDPQHADLAVAPRLRPRPFDALVEVVDLPRANCSP